MQLSIQFEQLYKVTHTKTHRKYCGTCRPDLPNRGNIRVFLCVIFVLILLKTTRGVFHKKYIDNYGGETCRYSTIGLYTN